MTINAFYFTKQYYYDIFILYSIINANTTLFLHYHFSNANIQHPPFKCIYIYSRTDCKHLRYHNVPLYGKKCTRQTNSVDPDQTAQGWLVGCFGFNGPLRQYFSLYQAVSQREGERGEKG